MLQSIRQVTAWLVLLLPLLSGAASGEPHAWVTSGFEGFSAGTFDASGYNLYVSRQGRLQMIQAWDVNHDGNVDLFFGNSHDGVEYMPALIYLQRDGGLGEQAVIELPSQHSRTQCIADLNGDGYNDVVVVNYMVTPAPVNRTYIYWGGPEGLGGKYRTSIPTFAPQGAVAGDLNGDGLKELIVANAKRERFDLEGRLSIYWQTAPGLFPLERRQDLAPYNGRVMDAADADGDGCDDLVFHGRPDPGTLSPEARAVIEAVGGSPEGDNLYIVFGKPGGHEAMAPLPIAPSRQGTPRFLHLGGKVHLAVTAGQAIELYAFAGRQVESPLLVELGGVRRISAADVNGDGIEDLVCHRGSTIDCLLGDAQGYDPARVLTLAFEATDAVAGDVTGDGRPDIVASVFKEGYRYAALSRVFVNGEDGLRLDRFLTLRTHGATEVHIADLDHDGKNDVSFACSIGGDSSDAPPVRVYLGDEKGDYRVGHHYDIPAISSYAGHMADYNDDGFVDLLVVNEFETQVGEQNYCFLYWGGPDGLSAERVFKIPSRAAKYALVADYDHDGYLDLAIGVDIGSSRLYYGGKDGFTADRAVEMPIGELTADINQDGWLDIFFYEGDTSRVMTVYLGGPDGFDLNRKLTMPMYGGGHMDVADLDGNGWLDLVIGSGGDARVDFANAHTRSSIWWGSAQGYAASRCTELALEQGSREVSVADLNKDGHLDIVMSAYNQGLRRVFPAYLLWGNPQHVYSIENATALLQQAPLGIQVADLNHDGWPDIAFCNHNPGGNHNTMSRIYWNRHGQFSDADMTLLPTTGAHNSIKQDLGNLYTRRLEETYTSAAFERPAGRAFTKLSWTAENRFGTSVVFQVRSGATQSALAAAPWIGPLGADSYFTASDAALSIVPPDHTWIQYRAILRTPNGAASPVLTRVQVDY